MDVKALRELAVKYKRDLAPSSTVQLLEELAMGFERGEKPTTYAERLWQMHLQMEGVLPRSNS